MQHYFSVGDRVNKKTGYKFPGVVRTVFNTSKGEVRYVVELDELGLLHIFNGEQLECGELLEGGTVEKEPNYCSDCGLFLKSTTYKQHADFCHKVEKNESHDKPCCYHQPCGCDCHHKKEEEVKLPNKLETILS